MKTNDKVSSSGWCLVNKRSEELATDSYGPVLRSTRASIRYWRDNKTAIPANWRIARAEICATVTK